MLKKIKISLMIFTVVIAGILFSACDPGIYDLAGQEGAGGMDIKDFLDPETCYNQLMDDLLFMKDSCYSDEILAGAQAYTILMSYGLADTAKDVSSFTNTQLETKAYLFSKIKLINLYSNNFTEGELSFYNQQAILQNTESAIYYCGLMLTYV